MLAELSIRNFAIIKSVTIPFNEGMTVLTGETGAGKSIMIDAMNLLLGSRSSVDFIRHGEEKAEIEGLFFLESIDKIKQKLYLLGIDLDDSQLVIKREIYRTGRSICRINGHLVTLSNLKEIGAFLVDIHGQHDHQELMQQAHHLEMLDNFGDESFNQLKENYQSIFFDYAKLHKQLMARKNNQERFEQRLEELKTAIFEIENANLEVGEEERLKKRRLQLQNQQTIIQHLIASLNILQSEEYAPSDLLGQVNNEITRLSEFDSDYLSINDKIAELSDAIFELSGFLESKLDSFDYEGDSLDEVEERLILIGQLERKYGIDISSVLDYYQKISEEYESMLAVEAADDSLMSRERELKQQLVESGKQLNQARQKIAAHLEQAIELQFRELYLEKAQFKVVFSAGKYSSQGNETVAFFISMNPGEGFKPLTKTASGGELSRIMLALKAIFTSHSKTAIVFDEVDTGVSGRVAQAIAQKIHRISEKSQVLCISHLPQVAATADYQYFIEKTSDGKTTETQINVLKFDERVEEISRMIAGESITALTIEHAKEMLNMNH